MDLDVSTIVSSINNSFKKAITKFTQQTEKQPEVEQESINNRIDKDWDAYYNSEEYLNDVNTKYEEMKNDSNCPFTTEEEMWNAAQSVVEMTFKCGRTIRYLLA